MKSKYARSPGSEAGEGYHAHRGGRKGFDRSGNVLCKGCFELRNELLHLKAENKRLRETLKRREQTGKAFPEGAHTPPSKKDLKANSAYEERVKFGGARIGHPGSGREKFSASSVEEKVQLPLPACPECECGLIFRDTRERSVLEASPLRAKKVIYRCPRGVCPKCLKLYGARPTAIPKAFYGNSLLAQAAVLHFFHGVTIGKVITLLGSEVTEGGLIEAFHRLGKICDEARPGLIAKYRASPVKHADETGWRTDGQGGYAWLFCTSDTSIFEFRDTRASRVAREILGEDPLPGVLIVDRYGGYNKMPVSLQYCYAHLLREVVKLEEEFPEDQEVAKFSAELSLLLGSAMKLRRLGKTRAEFEADAQAIRTRIEFLTEQRFKHLGIHRIQEIFQRKRDRLFHWVTDPEIPAENNRAERELRPTVIARKVSFGSQSKRGAITRSHIMSALFTAKKRFPAIALETWLTQTLDGMAENPKKSFAAFLEVNPQ